MTSEELKSELAEKGIDASRALELFSKYLSSRAEILERDADTNVTPTEGYRTAALIVGKLAQELRPT